MDAYQVFEPRERISVTEWAERELVLSERSTPYAGPFRCDVTPYLREILDSFSDPFVREITICTAAQVAKTTAILVCMGFTIDLAPGPSLLVLPNNDLCRSFSEQRLHPMIDDSPSLSRHLPADTKKYRLQEIFFDRMQLALVGSNSPANLASRPIRYLFEDEIDKYPGESNREASAIDLVAKRTRAYRNHKIFKTSTPTTVDGEIWQSFLKGDQRYYRVPCPHCNQYQVFELSGIRVEGDARRIDLAWYECKYCQRRIDDHHKLDMLRKGLWKATQLESNHRSFHLAAIYAPWVSFLEVAREQLDAKIHPEKERDFYNSTMGEPYDKYTAEADEGALLSCRLPYKKGTSPISNPAAAILTADVQQEEMHYLVRVFERNGSSWLVDHGTVDDFPDLLQIQRSGFEVPDSPSIYPTHACIDSGFRTQEVYEFCRANRWVAVKGQREMPHPVQWRSTPGIRILHIDVSYFKEMLWLKFGLPTGHPGHWAIPDDIDMEYIEEILSEVMVEELDKWNRIKRFWKKIRRANHKLDLEVYQLAFATVVLPENRHSPIDNPSPHVRKDGRSWLPEEDPRIEMLGW